MNFTTRSQQSELLDRHDIPFVDIIRNMQELEFINTYLGGHHITIAGIKEFADDNELIVCEIGCGGGDNLAVVYKWCVKNKIKVRLIGIDINYNCIEYAKIRNGKLLCQWIVSDYATVIFKEKPHVIFSSLFCHHFTDDQLMSMLNWMRNNSTNGFFVNDLHRHALAYYSIRMLTACFSGSYLVRHDAPLSVLRGFKRSEIIFLLKKSGINSASLKWRWAFRWLLVVKNLKREVEL